MRQGRATNRQPRNCLRIQTSWLPGRPLCPPPKAPRAGSGEVAVAAAPSAGASGWSSQTRSPIGSLRGENPMLGEVARRKQETGCLTFILQMCRVPLHSPFLPPSRRSPTPDYPPSTHPPSQTGRGTSSSGTRSPACRQSAASGSTGSTSQTPWGSPCTAPVTEQSLCYYAGSEARMA